MDNKWIKVDDMLPERNILVLLYLPISGSILLRFYTGPASWGDFANHPTHWMRLPSPPAMDREVSVRES